MLKFISLLLFFAFLVNSCYRTTWEKKAIKRGFWLDKSEVNCPDFKIETANVPFYGAIEDKWKNGSMAETLIIEKIENKISLKDSKCENPTKFSFLFGTYYITSYDSLNNSFSLVKPWYIHYYLKKGKNRLPKHWKWSFQPPKYKENRTLLLSRINKDSISCILKMQPNIDKGFVYKSSGIISYWGETKN